MKSYVGEDAGAQNVVFVRVKWLQPAIKGSSFVTHAGAVRSHVFLAPPMALRFQKSFRFNRVKSACGADRIGISA